MLVAPASIGRRSHGYGVVSSDGRVTHEEDLISCAHCQRYWPVSRRGGGATPIDVGWCGRCVRAICATCTAAGVCRPFEAWLEQQEARGRLLRSLGLS